MPIQRGAPKVKTAPKKTSKTAIKNKAAKDKSPQRIQAKRGVAYLPATDKKNGDKAGLQRILQFTNAGLDFLQANLAPPIMPTKPSVAIGGVKAKLPVGKKIAIPEDKRQVLTGTVTAFGVADVPTLSLAGENQHDITLTIGKTNFTFDQLFRDFNCSAKNFFVFDEVNIHIKEKKEGSTTTNIIRFNGKLRMNQEPLSSFRKFLSCEDGILVTGEMDTHVSDITEKIAPCSVELTSAATFLLPLADGIILKSAELKINLRKENDEWTFSESVTGILQINKLGDAPVDLNATVSYADKKLNLVAKIESVTGLFGIEKLNLSNLNLEFNIGKENDILLSGDFIPGKTTFHLAGRIAKDFAGMTASASSFTLADLNTIFTYLSNDTLSLPSFDMTFSDAFVGFATADGKLDGKDLKRGLTIGGSLKAYDYTATAQAQISPDGFEFNGSLDHLSIGKVNITKAVLHIGIFTAKSKKVTSFSILGETVIEGLKLSCKAVYERKLDGSSNKMVYAAIQANSFGLSNIIPKAKGTFVDSLKFSKVAFIYSSSDSETKDPDLNFNVQQGLQLMAVLEEVPVLTSLTHSKKAGLVLSAHYGDTIDISIELPDTRMQLGSSVTCDPMKLGIQISPMPSLEMFFGMSVKVNGQNEPLHFDLVLEIGILEARGSATMKGFWVDPFGVKGLQIGPELALQLGIIYATFAATGLPSEFGFAGGLVLGDVSGKMAVNVSEDPMHEILMGEIDKLSPKNLVAFASKLTKISINPQSVPNFFDIEKLKLYCAPMGGNIGTIHFEKGFSFIADLILFGKRIKIYTLFNDDGLVAKGELDKIDLGPLKIGGANGGNAKLLSTVLFFAWDISNFRFKKK